MIRRTPKADNLLQHLSQLGRRCEQLSISPWMRSVGDPLVVTGVGLFFSAYQVLEDPTPVQLLHRELDATLRPPDLTCPREVRGTVSGARPTRLSFDRTHEPPQNPRRFTARISGVSAQVVNTPDALAEALAGGPC